ncbi:MAG: hypothetical protein Q9172_001898 [Xanthocarpia lactea]
MAHLSKSFTAEELQQIESKHSRKALEDAIDKYGQSQMKLTNTSSNDDFTGNLTLCSSIKKTNAQRWLTVILPVELDAPAESEELDANRWQQSKSGQREKQHSLRKQQLPSRQSTSSASGDSFAASSDFQESPPLFNQQQDLPRPSPLLHNPITCVQATRASRKQDKTSRRRGRGSRVQSVQRPKTSSRDVPTRSIQSRAPTELEIQAARNRARSLSLELKEPQHDRADTVRKLREIQRYDVIADGGWIEQATQQELAVHIARELEQQAAVKKTRKSKEQAPVKDTRKRSRGGGKYSSQHRKQLESDEAGYLPGEKEAWQKIWAQSAKPHDVKIDDAGNIISQEEGSESDPDAYHDQCLGPLCEEDIEEARRIFEDDEDDDVPEPAAKKRRSGGDGKHGYQKR